MLLYNLSCNLDIYATFASLIIAAFAVLQFTYIIFVQARKEKKRNKKEWFHRLVIEPKIDEIFQFFDDTESNYDQIDQFLKNDEFTIEKALKYSDSFKDLIFRFRKSFVDLINPIDSKLASKIEDALDNLLDYYTENMFSEETFDSDKLRKIYNKFYHVQNKIIYLIYHWKN